jgi:diaminopropionate ammonia-lyase family
MARRRVVFNDAAKSWVSPSSSPTDAHLIDKFHKSLPDYAPTPLRSLNQVAQELGLGAVYLKDESSRLGLPSFKILGASWGTFRAVAKLLDLPKDTDLEMTKQKVQDASVSLYAATDGNHGRAVAKMGSHLGAASVHIYVPHHLSEETVGLIQSEGAEVHRLRGSYDEAVKEAWEASQKDANGIFVQDTAFGGYEEIPKVR